MCMKVKCPSCGKATFAGCGMHVQQVLGDVPAKDRCHCGEPQRDSAATKSGGGHR